MTRWNYPLCSCTDSCPFCILSFFLPFVGTAFVADKSGRNGILFGVGDFLCCITSIYLRGEIRKDYNIQGNCLDDCLTVYFCYSCASTQELLQLNTPVEYHTMDR